MSIFSELNSEIVNSGSVRYDSESVSNTVHEGIFVNKMESVDIVSFNDMLAKLKHFAFSEDDKATTDMIFTIVPTKYRKGN